MNPLLPFALTAAIAAAIATPARADTAYDALKALRESRGDDVLKSLIEVRGESGGPQPESWTIVMTDPGARGGVREFVVSGGQVVSERTPLRGYEPKPPPINFERLNLDSDGAFRIANDQAVARKVGFQTVDYTLRTADGIASPVWSMALHDYMGAPVGKLDVSAENGKVVHGLHLDPDARLAQQQPPPRAAGVPPPPSSGEDDDEIPAGGLIGRVGRTARNVGERVAGTTENVLDRTRRTTLRIAGNVQEFLTGERTVDRSVRQDEEEE